MPPGCVGARILRPDLEAVSIPYEDDLGRVADFHALRHSFITALASGGIHPNTAYPCSGMKCEVSPSRGISEVFPPDACSIRLW